LIQGNKTFAMIKSLLFFSLVSIQILNSADSAFSQGIAGREIIPFDEGWRFWLGDNPAAKQPVFDDTHWRILNIPHDWSIEGQVNPPPAGENNGGYFNHGIGWYRKNFIFPDTVRKVAIEFDGVYMNSDVWINGQFLGRKPYGFIGFRYDITEYLKKDGSSNDIAVRVDDSAEPSLRWYAGSGIYRQVRLIVTGYTHFRLDGGISISTPDIKTENATVKADYIIEPNFFSEQEFQAWTKDPWKVKPVNKNVILRSSVLAPDGTVISFTESKLALQVCTTANTPRNKLSYLNPVFGPTILLTFINCEAH